MVAHHHKVDPIQGNGIGSSPVFILHQDNLFVGVHVFDAEGAAAGNVCAHGPIAIAPGRDLPAQGVIDVIGQQLGKVGAGGLQGDLQGLVVQGFYAQVFQLVLGKGALVGKQLHGFFAARNVIIDQVAEIDLRAVAQGTLDAIHKLIRRNGFPVGPGSVHQSEGINQAIVTDGVTFA